MKNVAMRNEIVKNITNNFLDELEAEYNVVFTAQKRTEYVQNITDTISEEEYQLPESLFELMIIGWLVDGKEYFLEVEE